MISIQKRKRNKKKALNVIRAFFFVNNKMVIDRARLIYPKNLLPHQRVLCKLHNPCKTLKLAWG